LNNSASIKKLAVDVKIKLWAHEIKKEEYKKWYKQMLDDYTDNKNCDNMQINFRDTVNIESAIYQTECNGSFENCSISYEFFCFYTLRDDVYKLSAR
jgi:hypothetical protein